MKAARGTEHPPTYVGADGVRRCAHCRQPVDRPHTEYCPILEDVTDRG